MIQKSYDIDLDKINQFTRRAFTLDEIYAFNVVLCDNDVDRDFESFSIKSLEELATLFVGKTGIFNHDPKGENQTARIYETQVCYDQSKKTATGERYAYLLGKAYIVKSDKTNDLILEIEGGIKKEVSVNCMAGSTICSICGNDKSTLSCEHRKGNSYGGNLCYGILSDIRDAYEWSFVAIPAQKQAGVIKSYKDRAERKQSKMKNIKDICKSFSSCDDGGVLLSMEEASLISEHIGELSHKASLGEQYIKSVRDNVVRLGFLSENNIDSQVLESVVSKMTLDELLVFEKAYKLKLDNKNDRLTQLSAKATTQEKSNNVFKI